MGSLKNTTINDTGFLQLPSGTTAQRPASPVNGMMRYNTTIGQMETYTGGAWRTVSTNYLIEVVLVGGGGGGGASYNYSYGGGGGGGGGGFLQQTTEVAPGTAYSIVVGAGGAGASISAQYGTTGSASTGFGFTARGGQGGASYQNAAWDNPSTSIGSAGGAARDQPNYGILTADGQGNYGGATGSGCSSGGGGGGAGSNGYNGNTDCNNWRWGESSCGGDGIQVNWSGNAGGIIATSAKIYSVLGSGSRGANYTVQYSDDGQTWTTAFSGNMASTGCGEFTGTGSGNGSYGRHIYWRYNVGSATNNHHPRSARVWLTDAAGNQYLLKRFMNDNCVDQGNYQFTTLYGKFQEGTWYAAGGAGSFEANSNTFAYANGGKLPERGGRGSNCLSGTVYNYGSAGDANSGFGGGGANHNWYGGGYAGGSGIVIVRYYGPQRGSGGTVTSNNGYTIHTFTSSGTFTA